MLFWILTDMIIIYASLAELRIFDIHTYEFCFFVFIFKKKINWDYRRLNFGRR